MFIGCTEEQSKSHPDLERFVGKWNASDADTREFLDDGSCYYISTYGIYSIKNTSLEIALQNGITRLYDYTFSENDTILDLTLVQTGPAPTTRYKRKEN